MVNVGLLKKKPNKNSKNAQRIVNTTTVVPFVSFNDWNSTFLITFLIDVTELIIIFRFKQVDMTMKDANKFMITLSVDISDGRNQLAALKQQAMSMCVNRK